jgi:aspartate aminotransferase-like enzyme
MGILRYYIVSTYYVDIKMGYFKSRNFRLPGPVDLHPDVQRAMGQSMISHRGAEYGEILRRIVRNMQHVYQTQEDLFMLNCSGKGAVEAVVANLCSPESSVLVISNGYFGDNIRDTVCAYCSVRPIIDFDLPKYYIIDPGAFISPEIVKRALDAFPYVEAVFIVHNETSFGITNPIKAIGRVVRDMMKVFIVDGVSSVGGIDIKTDDWGIDVLITSSQKAIGAPPGVSFVSLSQNAWNLYNKHISKRYWDFIKIKEAFIKDSSFSTPPLPTVFGVDQALKMIMEEGLDNVFKRHEHVARRLWKILEDIGYKLFVKDYEARSNTVTSVYVPKGIHIDKFLHGLRSEYNIELAPGLAEYKDQIFRIGHMGCVTEDDIDALKEPLKWAFD